MVEDPHHHTVIPLNARASEPIAPFHKPRPLAEKLASQPLITAAVCVVVGAIAANIWAHRFGRTRSELEKQALHQLRLAQRLDPYGDTLL
jgi:hypothetical protein